MKKFKLIAISAAGLALALIVVFGLRDIREFRSELPESAPGPSGKEIPTIRFVKDPQPAPEFTLLDLDGRPLRPASWRGKVVLVNFWATWCAPCRAEIPDLIALQEKYEGRLVIVGLSSDTGPPETVKRFVRNAKMNYPVAIAPPEVEAQFGGVFGLPTSFVIDTQGRIVQKHIGLRNPALYEMEVRALLDLPVEAKVERFEDAGQVMLSNAKNATELPGVDLSKLSGDQKKTALRQMNEKECACGCGLTVAQCRVNDTSCDISKGMAEQIVDQIASGKPSLAPEGAKP